jgi:hypothetical protein
MPYTSGSSLFYLNGSPPLSATSATADVGKSEGCLDHKPLRS